MPSQSGKNIVVAYRVQPTAGTAPGTGSAKQLRIDASPGLSLKRVKIDNPEVRSDGLSSMPRLGSRMAEGSYNIPLTVGGIDDLLEAIMRSTWVPATAITQATAGLTSITTTASAIVASAGSWITAGVRVGDVARLTGHSTAGNNSINLRIKSVSALTLGLHGTPLAVDAVADTTFTLTILKKLKNATTPTKRAFYIEEYNVDIDQSEVFDYCKAVSLKITGSPDGTAAAEVSFLGLNGTVLSTAASPYFVSPTLNTALRLVFADATVSYGGVDVSPTAFEITVTITAKTEPVIGTPGSPDVFDNDMVAEGSLSFIRADMTNVTRFINETEVELHLMLVEPESEPKDCLAIYIPRIKLTAADAPLGGDGASIETLPFVTGKMEGFSATGYDDTLLTISTSAP